MRIFGLPIPFTGEHRKALSSLPYGDSRGWYPIIHEPYPGAWQQQRGDQRRHRGVVSCRLRLQDADRARHRQAAHQAGREGRQRHLVGDDQPGIHRRCCAGRTTTRPATSSGKAGCCRNCRRGNTYVLKVRDNRNVVTALHVLDPTRVQPLVSDDGSVFYRAAAATTSPASARSIVPAREIIHDRMNCLFHPLVGTPPVFASGLASMLGLNAQKASALLFENASMPGGILTAPGEVSADQQAAVQGGMGSQLLARSISAASPCSTAA